MKKHLRYMYSIMVCCFLAGLCYNASLHLPDGLFGSVEDTQWEYNDCGKVIFVDRTTSKESSQIAYYVTYSSEYYGENHTLKVTPSAYQSAKDLKASNGNICFGINAGPHAGWGFMFLGLWAVIIISSILIFRWGRYLILNKDHEPVSKYDGYY